MEKQGLFYDLIDLLAKALDFDEGVKLNHGQRVAVIAYDIAAMMQLPDRVPLYLCALLHDIGAIGLADHIVHISLRKESQLREVVDHAVRGGRVLRHVPYLKTHRRSLYEHHEHFDGTGYPHGLCGEAITLPAQIIGFADQVDLALRRGVKPAALPDEVRAMRDREYAAIVIDAFCALPRPVRTTYASDEAMRARHRNIRELFMRQPEPLDGFDIDRLLWTIAAVIDAKHAYTLGHSGRVTEFAGVIAAELGLRDTERLDLRRAAFLHDVGKVGVKRTLLEKEGKLTDAEFTALRLHATYSRELVEPVAALRHLAVPAACHQEKWDGSGYPYGFAAADIPFLSQILIIADAFDAMTSDRSYRKGMPRAKAFAILRADSGKHFPPALVEPAITAIDRLLTARTAA